MRRKIFLAALLLLSGFSIGALLGRRWRGVIADEMLTRAVFLAIALLVGGAIVWLWQNRDQALVPSSRHPIDWLTRFPRWRVATFLAAFALTGVILFQLPNMPRDGDHAGIIVAWLFAIIAYLVAVAPPRTRPRFDLSVWWRARVYAWRTTLLLSGITLVGFLLRVWEIGNIPFALNGDEASFGQEAVRVINGEIGSPFFAGHLSQPTLSFFYDSLAVRVLGPTPTGLRLPWALIGAATIPIAFWMAARLKGLYVGLVTAALLAVYHFHIHYSRLNLDNIADPFWGALALLFFYRAMARKNSLDWALTGAACAGALYFYTGARLVSLVIGAAVVYRIIFVRRFWREHRRGLLVALGAFLIVAAPMLQYAIRYPDEFNGRLNQTSILRSGWFEQQTAQGKSVETVLFDQFRLSALAFNLYPDFTNFYGLRQPLLDPIFGAVFLLGLGYGTLTALMPRGDRRIFPMVAWWWGGMILGGMLTEFGPASQRLITLALPVCFFIGLGLWQIVRLARKALTNVPARAILVAAVLLFSSISIYLYFVDFTPRRIAGGFNAEIATALAPVLKPRVSTHDVYFFGAPIMYVGFPTLPFLVPQLQGSDIEIPLIAPPPNSWLLPGRGSLFVFLPGRVAELEFVRQAFPNGAVQEIRRPFDQQVIVTLYELPP